MDVVMVLKLQHDAPIAMFKSLHKTGALKFIKKVIALLSNPALAKPIASARLDCL